MLDNKEQPLNTVSEVWLRKRKALDKEKRDAHLKRRQEQKQLKKSTLKTDFTSIHKLMKRRQQVDQESSRMKGVNIRIKKGSLGLSEEKQNKLLLVVRLDIHPTKRRIHKFVKQILSELRLDRLHSAVFVRNSPSMYQKLETIKPYIISGEPSLETVRNLINKRAYTMVDDKRVAISDNTMIEEALGEDGVICVEDIIHEIMNGDNPTFEKVNAYLAPFLLNTDGEKVNKVRIRKIQEKAEGQKSIFKNVNKYIEYYN
ncbi:unnamed protein product [Cunninghamella blakesleeana]